MKTIVLGDITGEGYNVAGHFNRVPEVVERIARRDINIVLVSDEILKHYDEHELRILKSTFARYGARLERKK